MHSELHKTYSRLEGSYQVIDARPEDSFYQHSLTAKRIAPPLYQKNVPAAFLLEECGSLKSDKELAKIFLRQDIDAYQKTIIMCDSNHEDACLV
jgi:3-mercaptopyruvate sulfurtransferase SseA